MMRLLIPYIDHQNALLLLPLLWLIAWLGIPPLTGHAQIDTTDFFPVREGNVWVYERCENQNCEHDNLRVEIVDTARTDSGSIMVEFDKYLFTLGLPGKQFRKDITYQVNIDVNDLVISVDTLIKSFNPKDDIGTSWLIKGSSSDGLKAVVDTIKTDTVFGLKTRQHIVEIIDFGPVNSAGTLDKHTVKNEWTGGVGITIMPDLPGPSSTPPYRLKGAYINGVLLGDTTVVERESVSNEEAPEVPRSVRLFPNYPNPFNPSTTIAFQLNRPLQVSLVIYDTMGREVARLLSEDRFTAGRHQVVWNAEGLASGVYYYRLRAGGKAFTQSMLLVK